MSNATALISSSVPSLTTSSPGRGPVRERRVAGRDREEADREREQQPARRDDRRVAQDRQAPLGAVGPERDVAQRDRQRDDHARREAVADIGVALDDDRGGDHDRGPEQPRRDDVDDGAHQLLPRRSRLATPMTATARTVISTIVSSPRKSARITVTTSPPCASRRPRDLLGRVAAARARPRERRPDRGERCDPRDDPGQHVASAAAYAGCAPARLRQPREHPDEDEREDRLDQDGHERHVRRARDRVDRGQREAQDREREDGAQPPGVADDGERRRHAEHEQDEDRQVLGLDRARRVNEPLGRREREAERDEDAGGDEHRRDAVAQVADLGVVEPVRVHVERPQRHAVPAARPDSGRRRAPPRRPRAARTRAEQQERRAERPRRQRHDVLGARVEVVGGGDVHGRAVRDRRRVAGQRGERPDDEAARERDRGQHARPARRAAPGSRAARSGARPVNSPSQNRPM